MRSSEVNMYIFDVKFLAILASILYTVIGLDYTQCQAEQEILSYLPSSKSGNFSFANCNKNAIINFTKLNISPDPVLFNRAERLNITVYATFDVKKTIYTKNVIEADIRLQLKTPEGYSELCELIGEEPCHYSDLIAELKKHGVHIPASLEKGNEIPFRVSYQLPTLPFILRGHFIASLFIKQQGLHISCLHIGFCVTECMF